MPLTDLQKATIRRHAVPHNQSQVFDEAGMLALTDLQKASYANHIHLQGHIVDDDGNPAVFGGGGAATPFNSSGEIDYIGVDSVAAGATTLDETFDYADYAEFSAVWTPRSLTSGYPVIEPGYAAVLRTTTVAGGGMHCDVGLGNFDAMFIFEASADTSDMFGLTIVDSSGNGDGFTPCYGGAGSAALILQQTAWAYGGLVSQPTGVVTRNGLANGLGIRRNGTTQKYYTKLQGGAWTQLSGDRTGVTVGSKSRLFIGRVNGSGNGAGDQTYVVRRVLIGPYGSLFA